MTNIWSETGKALALKELGTTPGAVVALIGPTPSHQPKSALWVSFSCGILLNEALS
jgi:hypothetical protein